MPEPRVFGADEVARKEFATSFRGFDQHEVRAFLGRLAAELAALQTRERALEERLVAAEARAVPTEIGETELENALGLETAKVLHAAREAAGEIRSRAEEQVARLLRQAGDDAARMREEAGSVLAERTAEAERAAAAIRDEATREAEERRAEADAAATAVVEAAKEHGRQMVGEAQVVRERILKDLARRRRTGQQQLEQLRAGRDRLLEACREVQAALDTAVAELVVSEPEARAAAETAGLLVAAEPEVTVEELDVEVAAAVDAGLVVPPHLGTPEASDEASGGASGGAAGGHDGTGGHETPPEDVQEAAAPAARGGPSEDQTFAEIVDAMTSPVATPPSPPEPKPSPLRRRKKRAAPATVGVVDIGGAGEGVRLIPKEAAPAPAEPVEEPAAEEPAADPATEVPVAEAIVDAGAEQVRPDEPEQAAPEQAGSEQAAPEVAEAEEPAEAEGPAPADEGDAEAGPALSLVPPVADEGAEPKVAVDDVFARIRANRAEAVARATEVLAEDAPVAATEGEPGAGAEQPEVEGGAADLEAGAAVASAFEQRDAAVETHERALTKALKRTLADEQNELLDALRRARGVPALDALLPGVEAHEARYRGVAEGPLAAAAAAGAGVDDAVDMAEVVASLGREVVAGLRPRLEHALEEAGGDEAAANESLSAAYREWKSSRAEPIARHHVLAAHAEGAYAAADEGTLRWVVDPEAGCSPDCADNALAGPTAKGEPFPTGQTHPPAHPGCRCLVLAGAN